MEQGDNDGWHYDPNDGDINMLQGLPQGAPK